MEALRVFDGDRLRADLFAPEGERLYVTFRQRIDAPGAFDPPRPARTFIEAGLAHLHCQSRWNDWYVNGETAAFEAALAAVAAPRIRAIAMGFSMGGYAALRFARALRLDRVVLVSPQVSIHPEAVPWDRRFRRFAGEFDSVAGDLGRVAAPDLDGLVLADPFRPEDMWNAGAIRTLFPRLALARMAGAGHPASRILRAGGRFGALQRALLAERPDPGRVIRLHRESRRGTALYWRELSAVAAARGRPELSARAGAEAERLRKAEAGGGP